MRTLTVELTDLDSGDPIRRAVVTASARMTDPHEMATPTVRLRERRAARYTARIEFPMHGRWTIAITVAGERVIPARARLVTDLHHPEAAPAQPPPEEGHGDGHVAPLGTTLVDDELVRGDYARMASLWIHSVAAMGWIIGVVAMILALGTPPGVLTDSARSWITPAYRRWGGWLHWSLVPVIVGTGIYNMLYVSPFPLAYTPADLDRLRQIPYGMLYEGILVAKLSLFLVLLVTGTIVLARVVRREAPVAEVAYGTPHPPFLRSLVSGLGVAGVVYLAAIPLILGAAMALRYVHVLNHVAVVLRAG